MREIKFRGKRCNNKEWVYGNYVEATKSYSGKGVHREWIITGAVQNGGWFNVLGRQAVLGNTIGQYTGLKDKNGKEIYEGDICLVSCKYFNIKNQKAKVICKDGCFCFQYGCTDDYVKTYNAWDLESIEVIGNIYETQI